VPYSPLLLQLVVILAVARVLGLAMRAVGQPSVIGEMAAGIVLGPIVFGQLFPEQQAALFAKASLPALDGLSQVGLVLFMFIVGAELRLPANARREVTDAAIVGVAAVILPLLLGGLLGAGMYERFAPAGVQFWPFVCYMAAALSITAFPIMARILKERRQTHSPVGRLSLTSAAFTDVLAWIMLALVVVLAGAQHDWSRLWRLLGGLALLVTVVFGAVRPLMAYLVARFAHDGKPDGAMLALMLIGTFACAFSTKMLGVHPVFGAFLFGLSLPRDDRLLHSLIERIEHVAIVALMPVFFALAGLSTTPDAFKHGGLGAMAAVIACAVVGKVLGGAIGARITGRGMRESFAVGSLMNARGLMELIVMKVGLDIGVIGEDVFTMLLVMALVTTLMAGPMLAYFMRGTSSAVVGAGESPAR
jgi:Kef-type K+ transport system membrane component KefB